MAQFMNQIWLADVQTAMAAETVYRKIAEKPFTGVIAKGNAVTIPILSVGDFADVPADLIVDWGTATTSGVQILIDQAKTLPVALSSVIQAQSNADMYLAACKAIAGKAVTVIEEKIAGLYTGAGITTGLGDDTTPLTLNSASAVDFLNLVNSKLSDAKVPKNGRWIVVPASMGGRIRKALGGMYTDNSALLQGAVCTYDGLTVYESPFVSNTSGAKYKIMAGGLDSIGYVGCLESMVHVPAGNGVIHGEGVIATLVYGTAVTRAATLACATVSLASET